MLRRCYDTSYKDYHRYGGRGTTVCDRWRNSVSDFVVDMGPRPGPGFSLDRENNDGNYEPGNCRWATVDQQVNNRSCTKWITARGKRMTEAQWSRELGVRNYAVMRTLGAEAVLS